MSRGMFITLEGIDGCGKTTQAQMLESYLLSLNIDVLLIREPGGSKIGEKIRSILLDKDNEMFDLTELMLFISARTQIVREIINPALDNGMIVLCDRFIDSTYAYQGFGRGINLDIINNLNSIAMGSTVPNLTLLYDISPKIGLSRRYKTNDINRLDSQSNKFYQDVHKGYLYAAKQNFFRIKTIDANQSIESVFIKTKEIVNDLLKYRM